MPLKGSNSGRVMMGALHKAATIMPELAAENPRKDYLGGHDLLVLFGVGGATQAPARAAQLAAGGRALLWDLGYYGVSRRLNGYLRMSIDQDHPWHMLDHTTNDPSRWAQHGIQLHNQGREGGPIILVGIGLKTRVYLKDAVGWEIRKLHELRKRFPGRRIIYRPKPGKPSTLRMDVEVDAKSDIKQLLRGAGLVVCRHSNVAIDAVIAGVPFECEDGAALWLQKKNDFSLAARQDFLHRLSWWQWRPTEARSALDFAVRMLNVTPKA